MVEAEGHSGGMRLAGRERELAILRSCLQDTLEGQSGVVTLAGEAGIGKTRLVQALVKEARRAGAHVLQGNCYEGDWAPPYAPWSQALAKHLQTRLLDDPGDQPDSSHQGLVEPNSLLWNRLSSATGEDSPPDDEARFRMHEAATRIVVDAAGDRPLVLVLEDLQWADRSSLGLLEHLGRNLDRARLLLVLTYRDVELERDHSLTTAMANLRRMTNLAAIPVRGLDLQDLTSWISVRDNALIDDALVGEIHTETGGNPFYVLSVLQHLRDTTPEPDLQSAAVSPRSVRELGVPSSVREVVALRIARLDERVRALVDLASVFTGGIDFPTLVALTDLPETAVLNVLDQLLARDVLRADRARPGIYDFSHAIVRHAIYDFNSPSRNARFHRQAAEALAQAHPGQERWFAPELAIQYRGSVSIPGAEQGVVHALQAAEDAQAALDRLRAITFFKIAVELGQTSTPEERARLRGRLAVAQAEALQLADAEATSSEVLALPDVRPQVVAEIMFEVASALKGVDASSFAWQFLMNRGLAILGDDHSLIWARLKIMDYPVEPIPGPFRAARWAGFDPEAVVIARQDGTEDDYARTLISFEPRSREEMVQLLERGRKWRNPRAVMRALMIAAHGLQHRHGAFREATAIWCELLDIGERSGVVRMQGQASLQLTTLYATLGHFDHAREAYQQAIDRYAHQGPNSGLDIIQAGLSADLAIGLDGDWPAIATNLEAEILTSSSTAGGFENAVSAIACLQYAAKATMAHARAGNKDRARWLALALADAIGYMDPRTTNQYHNGIVAFVIEALWIVDSVQDKPLVMRYLDAVNELIDAGLGDYPQTSLLLSRARAQTLLGEDARSTFAEARVVLKASGQQPLLAITDYDEAIALLRRGADLERVQYLAQAAEQAMRELGMEVWARRAGDVALRARERGVSVGVLSDREVDVLRLMARGYSDRQIADELFISTRTVNAHVRNMLTKTRLTNRTELSVWGVDHAIVSRDPSPRLLLDGSG